MNKSNLKCAAIAVAGCMAISAMPVYGANASQIQQKKSAIESQMYSNALQIQSMEKEKNQVLSLIQELDAKAAKAQAELESLAVQIEDKTKEIELTQQDLEKAREEERIQYEDMKKRIQYLYESGGASMVSVILQSENFAEVLSRTENFQQMTRYDRNKLKEYKEVCHTIEELEKSLNTEKNHLETYEAEAKQEKQNIETSIAKKQEEIRAFEASIGLAMLAQADLEGDLAVQNQMLQQIYAQANVNSGNSGKPAGSAGTSGHVSGGSSSGIQQKPTGNTTGNTATKPSGSANTGFVWPCPGAYGVTSNFGHRDQPTAGASTDHKGIDLGAAGGSSILAAMGGTVVNASYSESAGNYVTIDHGNGLQTVYMHASSLNVKPGQTVTAGQQIAAVGSTGYSTGNHLHFGVVSNGNYVNPMDYYK